MITPDTEQMAGLADEATALLKAFAHPARLLICCQLKDREMSVGEIEQRLGIRQPRLSRELAKLREEGLVEARRSSKMVFYRLSPAPRVVAMINAICTVMLGGTLDRLAQPSSRQPNTTNGGYGVFASTQPLQPTGQNGGSR